MTNFLYERNVARFRTFNAKTMYISQTRAFAISPILNSMCENPGILFGPRLKVLRPPNGK